MELTQQQQFDFDSETNDNPESIFNKATTVTKYLTLDIVLEKNNQITEAQLKRMLYKADYDEEEQERGLLFRLKRKLFG